MEPLFNIPQKIDISIGIVCMINNTAQPDPKKLSSNTFSSDLISFYNNNSDTYFTRQTQQATKSMGRFHGRKRNKALYSSYFYVYILLQIPSGWLASKVGGQRVLVGSMFFNVSRLIDDTSCTNQFRAELYFTNYL